MGSPAMGDWKGKVYDPSCKPIFILHIQALFDKQ